MLTNYASQTKTGAKKTAASYYLKKTLSPNLKSSINHLVIGTHMIVSNGIHVSLELKSNRQQKKKVLNSSIEATSQPNLEANDSTTNSEQPKANQPKSAMKLNYIQRYVANSTKNMPQYPDGNWNRIPGSKLKTTTIKTNLSNPSTVSSLLKTQQKYQNLSKSSIVYNNGQMSREVSIIDLKLPMNVSDSQQSKRKTNSVIVTDCNENEASTPATFASNKLMNAAAVKPSAFPSPISSEGHELNSELLSAHEFDSLIKNRNKNYLHYVMNQQKKRQLNLIGEPPNLSKQKFLSHDISIGSGLNNISTNSLLIRRLKF